MTIEPEGFDLVRSRGGKEHRLRSGDNTHKWRPLGVGSIEPEERDGESLQPPKKELSTGKEDE